MKILSFFFKFIFALFLGILLSIYWFQYQIQLKNLILKHVKIYMQETLKCDIECNIGKINLFFPFIQIKNVCVTPCIDSQDWNWKCNKISVSISWLDILASKSIKPKIIIDNFKAFSQIKNNNLAIGPHFQDLLFSGNNQVVPVIINDLKLNKSSFTVKEFDKNLKFKVNFDCQTTEIDKVLQNKVYLNGGQLSLNDTTYCSNILGHVHLGLQYSGKIENFSLDGSVELNHLNKNENKCFFVGKWNNGANNCLTRLSTIDGKAVINILLDDINSVPTLNINMFGNLSTVEKIIQINSTLESEIDLNLNINLNNLYEVNGKCIFVNPHLTDRNLSLDYLKLSFENDNNELNGLIEISKANELNVLGNISYDHSLNQGNLEFKNLSQILILDKYKFNPKDLFLSLNFNNQLEFNGSFNCQLLNELNSLFKLSSNINGSDRFLDINGALDEQTFDFKSIFKPSFKIEKFTLCNKNNECVSINYFHDSLNNIKAALDCCNIKAWLCKYFDFISRDLGHILFSGQGKLELEGECSTKGFHGNISLKNGNIIIPSIHNIITDIKGLININIQEKRIILKDFVVNFHKGEFECKKGIIIFNDYSADSIIKFLHLPIVFKKFFINWENVVYSKISGRLLIEKIIDKNILFKGFIALSKSEIKDNIFSNDFRKNLFQGKSDKPKNPFENFVIDISIFTKMPIRLKTIFFKSYINLDLNLKKDNSNFDLIGDINLNEGVIIFPYRDLKIINANIKFLPGRINDPLINLIAKNKIKDYLITLQVMGFAQSPHILLESNPTLTEEQIISLLLIGSESSLNLVIPALLVQNIKNIAIGSAQFQEKLQRNFKIFLKPFKNIRLVPTFNDTTGNKGLTATLDIDINDRLNASIQKNFAEYQEPRIDVNFALTDDVILRGVKDAMGNLSGEFELRFKF